MLTRLWYALGYWRLRGYDGRPTPWSTAWELGRFAANTHAVAAAYRRRVRR